MALLPGAAVTEAELLEHCRLNMARFMVPDVIETVDELPRTPTGKIAKSQLPGVRSYPLAEAPDGVGEMRREASSCIRR